MKIDKKQKCWYCKRNDADESSRNAEISNSTNMEFSGIYKYKVKTSKERRIARCKECEIVHRKGIKTIDNISLLLYPICYIFLLIIIEGNGWFKYFILIFLSVIPWYFLTYLVNLFVGSYYANKYKTQPRWAGGGDVL